MGDHAVPPKGNVLGCKCLCGDERYRLFWWNTLKVNASWENRLGCAFCFGKLISIWHLVVDAGQDRSLKVEWTKTIDVWSGYFWPLLVYISVDVKDMLLWSWYNIQLAGKGHSTMGRGLTVKMWIVEKWRRLEVGGNSSAVAYERWKLIYFFFFDLEFHSEGTCRVSHNPFRDERKMLISMQADLKLKLNSCVLFAKFKLLLCWEI